MKLDVIGASWCMQATRSGPLGVIPSSTSGRPLSVLICYQDVENSRCPFPPPQPPPCLP